MQNAKLKIKNENEMAGLTDIGKISRLAALEASAFLILHFALVQGG
jgi:hypothetical protein